MTVLRIFILGLLLLTSTTALMAQPGPVASPSQTPIVVDHNSVALFERIPENYLLAAQATSMLYMDRSVGGNISEGLDCLAYPTDEVSRNHCRRWEHVDPNFSVSRDDLNWSRPGGYSRANWDFVFWPGGCSDWSTEVGCFFTHVDNHLGEYSVVSFQFSYLEISPYSEIADRPGGFFWDNSNKLDVYDLEAYEAAHPEMEFIYWTTSLSRSIGSLEGESFNDQMRQYAIANGKPLFDVADILSHDPDGKPCYDNRDGRAYDNGISSENYPDDGLNTPAICQHYTTEVDGGHLGTVSIGKIRAAKAFWVLMAQLAGWNPGVTSPPTATATRTFVPPTATATRTSVPPTATATRTSVPPTATATRTSMPPAGNDRAYLPLLLR